MTDGWTSFMMPAMRLPLACVGALLAGLVLLGVACSLPGAIFPTPTPGPTATPTITPTPTSTPTPTPSPTPVPVVRIETAELALRNGDWDLALQEFRAALTGGADPEIRAAAQMGVGATLLRAGRAAEAAEALAAFLTAYPEHPLVGQVHVLLGLAREQQGQLDLALQSYLSALEVRPGRIDSFLHEKVGDALRSLARPLEAVEAYQQAIGSPRLGGILGLEIKIGRAYLEAGELQTALSKFDQVLSLAGSGVTKASMNLLAGDIYEALGDQAAAHERYLDSVTNYPEAYDTYVGLIRLVNAGVPVDEFQRAYVDYHAGAYEPALSAFDRHLSSIQEGRAYYFRALTKLELGDAAGARDDFQTVIEQFPQDRYWVDAWLEKGLTEWAYLDDYAAAVETYLGLVEARPESGRAAEALFSAGRVAERMDDLARAAEIWLRVAKEYPSSADGYQGAFEAGVVLYRLDKYPEARAAFELASTLAPDSGRLAKAQLWIGKTHQEEGNTESTVEAWQAAARSDPTGYYSVRAEDLLAGREAFEPFGLFDFSADVEAEQREAEAWLRDKFAVSGSEPLSALNGALAIDSRMVRGEEFLQLGLFGEARSEFESLRSAIQDDPEALYRFMHEMLELHQYRQAILSARRILHLAGLDEAGSMTAPVYFNRIRFGPYFGDLILPEAVRNDFDGLFLLAVVRQESLFEGFATSYAEARGLMQVIPSTGRSIADQLGWPPDYTQEDLYRPVVSVRYGTFYLSRQRDRFDGDLFAALAAYNGGPGNAAVWMDLAPDDPDLFLEVIRLTQPHFYIRVIYEVFGIYRALYSG